MIKASIATIAQLIFTLVVYMVVGVIMGLSLFPGVLLCQHVWAIAEGFSVLLRALSLSFALTIAYFLYGSTLMLIVAALRVILNLDLKRSEYRIISVGAAKWAFTNALFLLVSITFMEFILLTPFIALLYRMMGAKVGRNVQINSRLCADISLIEIGDNSVIGGRATVMCHSFERNRLILKKVRIGRNVVIGLNAVIMPGCEIGDGAIIAAGAVLGKNTKVEPRTVYCGVPAEPARNRMK
jgi:acetyltransferase-like isoleucine patch superfamily enzyme